MTSHDVNVTNFCYLGLSHTAAMCNGLLPTHTTRKNHNKSTIVGCKLFSQSVCRKLLYLPRPLTSGTIRIVPEILLPTNYNYCFVNYFHDIFYGPSYSLERRGNAVTRTYIREHQAEGIRGCLSTTTSSGVSTQAPPPPPTHALFVFVSDILPAPRAPCPAPVLLPPFSTKRFTLELSHR